MKIVHVTSAHSRNSSRIFHKMALSSVRYGHSVSLVVADGKKNNFENSISFYDVGSFSNKYLRFFISSFKVVRKAKTLNADIYHLHDPDLLLWALLLRFRDTKVIFDAHEDYPLQILHKHYIPVLLRKPLSIAFGFFQMFICKRLYGVIAATPFIRKKFCQQVARTVDIKNYPIRSEFDSSLSKNLKRENDSFVASYIGGITTVRGIKEVVQAFGLLNNKFSLKLAGNFLENNLQNELQSMIGWSNVDYKGFLSRSEVVDLLRQSSCGIVTLHPTANYIDALPIKMFEYMAVGLPVIASDFPLLRSIIEGYDCGLLVDPQDPNAISKAIQYLYDNPIRAMEMGHNGEMAFLSSLNFDSEAIILNEFYRG